MLETADPALLVFLWHLALDRPPPGCLGVIPAALWTGRLNLDGAPTPPSTPAVFYLKALTVGILVPRVGRFYVP